MQLDMLWKCLDLKKMKMKFDELGLKDGGRVGLSGQVLSKITVGGDPDFAGIKGAVQAVDRTRNDG